MKGRRGPSSYGVGRTMRPECQPAPIPLSSEKDAAPAARARWGWSAKTVRHGGAATRPVPAEHESGRNDWTRWGTEGFLGR